MSGEGDAGMAAEAALNQQIPNPVLDEPMQQLGSGEDYRRNADRLLKTIRGEPNDSPPIWIMRQAGRYLEEFRTLRAQNGFFQICQTPELAAEVTLMPIKRFDLDAAIIFSDILVIPQALGMEVTMQPGVGPVLPTPLTIENVNELLQVGNIREKLSYVGDAIRRTKELLVAPLPSNLPVFGFSGAPWTLMAYMIEGGGTKTCSKAKKWLYAYPEESHKLLDLLTNSIIEYLKMQVDAGADILQIFDSSAEYLNQELYSEFCIPYLQRIRDRILRVEGKLQTPMVLFAKGAYFSLNELANLRYQVLGIDWTVPVSTVHEIRLKHPNLIIQGNLDPCALYGSREDIIRRTRQMIAALGPDRYIVNLGHGIYPDTSTEAVEAFIYGVRTYNRA